MNGSRRNAGGRDTGRRVAWLCIGVGIAGYLLLIGVPMLGPGAGAGEAFSALVRLAPIWLVLWLVAGAGIRVHVHWRGRRFGQTGGDTGAATPRCPQCGLEMQLRRRRDGVNRGAPYRVCPEHGEPEP